MSKQQKKLKSTAKQEFTNKLIKLVGTYAKCTIQHKGSPCDTCFHYFGNEILKLNPTLTYAFWIIILSLRGDYPKRDIEHAIKKKLKKVELK